MLKQTLKQLIRVPRYKYLGTRQIQGQNLIFKQANLFSSGKEPPKGFSKFQRKKSTEKQQQQTNTQKEIKKEQQSKENEQFFKQQEQQEEEFDVYEQKKEDPEQIQKENKKEQQQKQQQDSNFFAQNFQQLNEQFKKEFDNQKQSKETEQQNDDQYDYWTPQGFDKFKRRRKSNSSAVTQNIKKKKDNNDIKNDNTNQTIIPENKDQIQNEQEKQYQDLEKELKENFENLTKEEKKIKELEQEYRKKSDNIEERSKLHSNPEDNKQEMKPQGFTQDENGKFKKKEKKEKKKRKEDPSFFSSQNEHNQDNNWQHNKQQDHNNQQQPKSPFQQNGKFKMGWRGWTIAGLSAMLLGTKINEEAVNATTQISYSEFFRFYLERDNVLRIQVNRKPRDKGIKYQTVAKIYTKDGEERRLQINHLEHFLDEVEKIMAKQGKTYNEYVPIDFQYITNNKEFITKILNLLMLGATLTLSYMVIKNIRQQMQQFKNMGGSGGDMLGMGNKVKIYGVDSKIDIKFKDVAGQEEQKEEIMEFVDFLKNPKKYNDLGARIPKGALLSGPPGTGKTLLAKACAGEAGVPFLFMSGSDFVEMYVGVGSSRVRDLFTKAKEKSPSIIFIDEIDAVGKKRNSGKGKGNDERDNTLNQMLVEMDGFGTDSQVVVLAATNRADLLDPALKRPGRFDRQIEVQLPDIDGRKQIFLVHLKNLKLDHSTHTMEDYAKRLATLTPGFSGADIANLCNEAALLGARKNKSSIQSIDFEMAAERVMAGLKRTTKMDPKERETVAVHEAGHAVVGWFLEGGHPLIKVTIIPRSKGSLGYAQYLPNESTLDTKQDLLDRICGILGGRVAEEIFFGKITTGAANDLEKAYEMAYKMVVNLGMSERIGYVGYKEEQGQKSYSKITNKEIDDEINLILREQTERCREVILQYREKVEKLSQALLDKDTLDLRQITEQLGERPFTAKSNYRSYLETSNELHEEIEEQKTQEQLEKEKELEEEEQEEQDKQTEQEKQEQEVQEKQEKEQEQQKEGAKINVQQVEFEESQKQQQDNLQKQKKDE